MRRRLASALLTLLTLTTVSAQQVPHEKYQLENGMTVILHEDHRLPQVCVNLWYGVGSKNERLGRSGFAHLFEHLMFMGTERMPGSGFDDLMEAGGGYNNASTSNDRTNYYDIGPAELLPTLLWLEADRLEALGATMTQDKLDAQRDVVRNERRQNYEIQPYGQAYLKSFELLYPPGHPYHFSVIGEHADLEAATVGDVQDFFATYYVPNNASLVVAGDFRPEEIKPLIDKLFGTLPRGATIQDPRVPPLELSGELEYTLTDDVQFAQTSLIWHSPAFYHAGDAEMDIIASLLADGVSGWLYQALVVERKLALEVSAGQASRQLGSTFEISAIARPGVPLRAIEIAIDESLARLRRDGIGLPDLQRLVTQIELSSVGRRQSLQGRADLLNNYQFYFGEPDSFDRDLARYQSVSRDSVKRFAQSIFGTRDRVVLHVLPEAEEPSLNPRDQRPESAAASDFNPPVPTSFTLDNGLRVHLWERPDLPLVELTLMSPYGSACDPEGSAGLTSLAAEMLSEGAGGRTALEFAEDLTGLGAHFSASVDAEGARLRFSSLARSLGDSLGLFSDALLRPRFDEKELERVRDLRARSLEREVDNPQAVAARVAALTFFGSEHPFGRPTRGTPESVRSLSRAALRKFNAAAWRPTDCTLLIAGDLTRESAAELLERALGKWREPEAAAPTLPAYPSSSSDALRVVIVDRPGAVQTVVRFMLPAPAYRDEQRLERKLLATILGGSFTSRLNQNIRERNGYAYGARARFRARLNGGFLEAYSSVRADVTGAAVGEFMNEFRALRSGDVSVTEAAKARATLRLRAIESSEDLRGVLSSAEPLIAAGLPFEALANELNRVAGIQAETLNAIAQNALPLEQALLVLVGDAALIQEQLGSLDLPEATLVDANGVATDGN